MLIWSGRGLLLFLIVFVVLMLSLLIPTESFLYNALSSLYLGGFLTWFLGKKWNKKKIKLDKKTGQYQLVQNRHTLYFVPIEYLGLFLSVVAVLVSYKISLSISIASFMLLVIMVAIVHYREQDNKTNVKSHEDRLLIEYEKKVAKNKAELAAIDEAERQRRRMN